MNQRGDRRMQQLIWDECNAIARLLIAKNQSYGNSVAEPANVFSRANPLEQIDVRIDDKLNRIKKGAEYENEDTEKDLIGYLVLKRCVRQYLSRPKEDPNDPFEEEDPWVSLPIRELSDDDLDRAADLFLAHTGGSDRSAQFREGVCSCGGKCKSELDDKDSKRSDPEEL